MKNFLISVTVTILCTLNVSAQFTPELYSWIINTTGDSGYANILTNVQAVQYSVNNVYVSCTCIPGYDIGPWTGNPNTPSNQNFVFKITRNPVANSGTPVTTPMGHIGVWSNGVSIFNPKDGMSYSNMGIWNQNAIVAEAISFDNCLGHPAPNGEYHHHLNPTCLYDDSISTQHSPIIGFAFDGFPVYGAYGYDSSNGTGGIRRMNSSYRMRNMSNRTTLPNGTVLTPSQYGPAINASNPLGMFIEDFEYVSGLGDLDEHNGRFCVTPDYPSGIYAYFVSLDSTLVAAYPYVLGPTYYGTVQAGNTGPGSGHVTISEPVVSYIVGTNDLENTIDFTVFPNPCSGYITCYPSPETKNNMEASITDMLGKEIMKQEYIQPAIQYTFDLQNLDKGIYFFTLKTDELQSTRKILKVN